jgi:hypothetical protein
MIDTYSTGSLNQIRFSSGTPVSFTNKTDRPNITEILLKVALATIPEIFLT